MEEKILAHMRETEKGLINLRETLTKRNVAADKSHRDVAYRVYKLHGMMDVCDLLKINRTEFNWIFNI